MLKTIVAERRKNSQVFSHKSIPDKELLKRYNFVDIKIGSSAECCLHPAMRESKYGKIRYDGPPLIKPPEYK